MVISIKLLKKLKQLLNNIPKYIILFVWFVPNELKKMYSSGITSRRIKEIVFVGNRPRRIKIIVFVGNRLTSPTR